MRQLSPHEASFLYAESVHANSNVTFVQIYDQRTAPGGTVRFKSILAHIDSRLHRSPVFRNRLLRVPFELDYPYWVEDEHFDLEYHVRHIALPKPGDWRQFCIQASRIHARALDLHRPLWEIYVIEGLDSITDLPAGSFALLTKIHHAAIDVERRNELIEVLHDGTRRPSRAAPPEPWFPQRAPGAVALACRGIVNRALSPLTWIDPLVRRMPEAVAFAGDLLRPPQHSTATRFNAVVSPHRVFDTRRFMLDELHDIRSLVEEATVNDAVLAVCAGGLRSYLSMHGELPAAGVSALAPLSIRSADAVDAGAEAPALRVDLGTHLADPVQRLRWIHRQTSSPQTRGATLHVPVLPAPQHGEPLACCTVTNVAAPARPLYLNGARMTYFSAIMPIADGMGLVFAVTSYDGRIVVSPTSCRELMPDPLVFTQCVRDSFQELLALARRGRPAAKVGKGARTATRARQRASATGRRSLSRPTARTVATGPRAGRGGRQRSTAPRR